MKISELTEALSAYEGDEDVQIAHGPLRLAPVSLRDDDLETALVIETVPA